MITKIKKHQDKKPYAPKVIKKDGGLTQNAKDAIHGARIEGRKIYPVDYQGTGRHISVRDRSAYILLILNAWGHKYQQGNDAPRGGASGYFIQVSSRKVIEKLESLLK